MGGRGSLAGDQPRRTVGSVWPYAPAVFDYVRRAMPYVAPQSLSDDAYYAIAAYVLHLNELLPVEAALDAAALRRVEMPNRGGFILDDRPDVQGELCMTGCRGGRAVAVTGDSRRFVAPGRGSGVTGGR